jgi:protein arginine N-methyltransferase 1
MYSVVSYGLMAADPVRMDAYARAVAATVQPGNVVVDLGCGPGILSLLALRAGASRVHAIDVNPAVWIARDLAAENGFGGKLEVHQRSSFDVELREQADVIIADLRGSSPLFEHNIAALEDARKRWLAPGGVLVPVRDRLFVTLVESNRLRENLELGWSGLEHHGFAAEAARIATLNCTYSDQDALVLASQVLSESKQWAEIRYGEPHERSLSATVDLTMTRGGTAHALALWFEATLHDDIVFDNAPGKQLVYKRTILPLLEPVRVERGESAQVTLRADVGGQQWAWDTAIADRARFRQATFLGLPTSPDALLRESLGAAPSRSGEGDRASRVLALMDGTRTLHAIADAIAASEPAVRRETILDEVKSCARRYAR